MLDLLEVLRNAVLITGLVLIMMLMIEYCNIGSHGSLFARLRSSGINQVLIGTLLGLVPGCIGGFAAYCNDDSLLRRRGLCNACNNAP